ncbi:MAG TPA: ATP-binding protein [Anaerolineaceae bacterium]
MAKKIPFSSIEPQHLYEISKIVARADDYKPALDEITAFVHNSFIFDNLVVYQADEEHHLDVMYARAMGRGRSAEADIAWGEQIANQIILSGSTVLQEPVSDASIDRLNRPFLLGIPLQIQQTLIGVLVFIRFGSPPFAPEEVRLAEFIAQQISLLLERHVLQEQKQLVEAQNQQVKLQESFISTITHELRSPLGFIKGYTTTLLRSDMAWDQNTQQEFLNIIDQETDHLEELIENLLDSARLQSGQLPMNFQPVRIDGLMNDVIARAHLHHPALQIIYDAEPLPGTVTGDPRRLAQVLENIISNAVKYAPQSPLFIHLRPDEDWLYLTLEDHGAGIPEPYVARLFERFFRNPEQRPNIHGSGLGLFICKQIIEAHQGQIYVTSEVGKGTIFHIKLPMHTVPSGDSINQTVSEGKQ